jgi:hypothetical protein
MDMQRPHLNAEYLGPVCKFGPGGDYVSDWPAVPLYTASSAGLNPLGRVLEMIGRMTGLSSSESGSGGLAAKVRYSADPQIKRIIQKRREETVRAAEQNGQDGEPYAPTIAVVGDDSEVSDEPTLFSDHTGACLRDSNKPYHRIRTSRRSARKRVRWGLPKQGSLFEAHPARAKTA